MKKYKRAERLISFFMAIILVFTVFLSGCENKSEGNKKAGKKSEKNNSSSISDVISDNDDTNTDSDFDSDFDTGLNENLDFDIVDQGESITQLYVLNSSSVQNNMLGMGGIYHCYGFMPVAESRTYTDEMLQMEIDRIVQSGATIVRTMYSCLYAYDSENMCWNFDSEKMQGFYKFLDAMKKHNIDVFVNMGWSTADITGRKVSSDASQPNPFYILSNGDEEKCILLYYQWIIDSIKAILSRGYDNFKYMCLFTEPGAGYNYDEDDELIAAIQPSKRLSIGADKAMRAAGVRDKIKVVGPNTVHYNGLVQLKNIIEDPEMKNVYDIYSHHFYITDDFSRDNYPKWYYGYYSELSDIIKKTGKDFWVDEWNTFSYQSHADYQKDPSPLHGTQIALGMVAGMNSGAQTMLLWSLANQYWPGSAQTGGEWINGVQIDGLLQDLYTSTLPFPAYYAYSMVSRYVAGKNTVVYEGMDDDGIYLTACRLEDGNWTVIVVNMNQSEMAFQINFDKAINTKLYRHVYNPNTIKATVAAHLIDPDKTISKIANTFRDTISAYSVNVYTSVKG